MSANPRQRLGGTAGYQRPVLDVLDDLTDPGSADTSGPRDTSGSRDTPDSRDNSGSQDTSRSRDTPGTAANRKNSGNRGTARAHAQTVSAEPRDHVKVARSLADEMRDAVWFLSEHGRPRVQLGELFDEAVRAWLDEAKAKHNGAEPFPVRGRLR